MVMTMTPIFALITILLIFCFFFFVMNGRRKPGSRLPPSPPSLPIIGHMHLIGKLFHRSLFALSKKHGPIFLLHLGNAPTVVVSSAKIAEEVMKTQDLNFATRPTTSIIDRLAYGTRDLAFAPYGEYWRQVRKICVSHLLSASRVNAVRSVREEEVALFLAEIRAVSPASAVNLSKMMVGLTNDIICRVALGKKYYSIEEGFGETLKELGACLQSFPMRDLVPWLGFVDEISGLNARVRRCFVKLDGFLERVIDDHLLAGGSSQCDDFVNVLLSFEEKDDGCPDFRLSRGSIKAIINDMFIAGTDTIFNTMEWAMAELIQQPAIMKKVQEEIRRVIGTKAKFSEDDTFQMDYLKAVIKETLRLHPPLPMTVPREALQDTKLQGYDIPAKAKVFINAWEIGRDAEYWEKSQVFWPERFINSSIDFKRQDFHYIPFGAGRRSCPGTSLSLITITYVLANLLCYFDWEVMEEKKEEVLDMSEFMDINVHKKFPLLLTAKPYLNASIT